VVQLLGSATEHHYCEVIVLDCSASACRRVRVLALIMRIDEGMIMILIRMTR
jgi:hypothetical protein